MRCNFLSVFFSAVGCLSPPPHSQSFANILGTLRWELQSEDETLTQPDPNDLGTALLFHFDLATVAFRLRLRTRHVDGARREWDGWAVYPYGIRKELLKTDLPHHKSATGNPPKNWMDGLYPYGEKGIA